MSAMSPDTGITSLGECHYPSPLRLAARGADDVWAFTGDAQCVRGDVNVPPVQTERLFEKAGPRESLYFDPRKARAAIVTCGGLCPGLNNVIRSATLECCRNYGLSQVFGVRFGYQGLGPDGEPFAVLTPEVVEGIDRLGGTILGSSRGSPETAVMVDCLQKHGINILLCVGGDGTQRGAYRLHEEIVRRGLKIAVVGIPKTIDNDIQWCDQTFGFFTAADCAKQVITSAHVEAKGARNGIALVKLMGRDSGFVAAGATLASGEVNFTLIPEQRFALRGETV
ncbi:MAG TPA: 6-phosphofructokinase, partial [Oligoflexia bacterium]|nr:6-phosphofructokinase [Oligoflexia bacterium]